MPHILLVEDNRGDAELLSTALQEVGKEYQLKSVETGEACLDYLHKRRPFSTAPTPDLIVLDLYLPGKDGRAVLSEIKNDDSLNQIPIVVLTGSRSEDDVLACSELSASSFVLKPQNWSQYVETAKYLQEFWFQPHLLPPVWIEPSATQVARDIDVAEHALTRAQFHLKKANEILKDNGTKDWTSLLLLSLNIKSAWEAIRLHWRRARSTKGRFEEMTYEAPWLEPRIRALNQQLKTLEEATKSLAKEIEKASGSAMNEPHDLHKGVGKMISTVERLMLQESDLEYDSLIEPAAQD